MKSFWNWIMAKDYIKQHQPIVSAGRLLLLIVIALFITLAIYAAVSINTINAIYDKKSRELDSIAACKKKEFDSRFDGQKRGYNPKTDSLINQLFDNEKPKFSYRRNDWFQHVDYTIKFDSVVIYVEYAPAIEFKRMESWSFSANRPNGSIVWIECASGDWERQVSPATKMRIKKYCISK